MEFIIGLIAIAIVMYAIYYLLSVIWPFLLLIVIAIIGWKIYESFYYKSAKFIEIKERINTYITDCNELNEHI